jgi:UDP-N-acetyl-D-glucosamine dehydrogenase
MECQEAMSQARREQPAMNADFTPDAAGTGQPIRLVVVGQGYVGLPLAMRAVESGYHVIGYDVDVARIARLAAATSYIEDISDDELALALAGGRYQPTLSREDCRDFAVAVITVPTPLREGVPDLTFIEEAAQLLGERLSRGCLIVLESTTYPGTTEELLLPILEQVSGLRCGTDFFVGYSPERIDPGNKVWGFKNTPKVVAGIEAASATKTLAFYKNLVDSPVLASSCAVAVLAKLIENTFRHVNIALINELAMFAAELKIDIWDAVDVASTKPYGFMPFTPGPGVGGHCLPIDPSYLSWRVKRSLGRNFRFVELANDINDHMPDYVVRRLVLGLNQRGKPLKGSRILLLGLAYKRNTSDARESPAARVLDLLLEMEASVHVVDPYVVEVVPRSGAVRTSLSAQECADADAVLILTDHDDFDYECVIANANYVFDTRNRTHGSNVEIL